MLPSRSSNSASTESLDSPVCAWRVPPRADRCEPHRGCATAPAGRCHPDAPRADRAAAASQAFERGGRLLRSETPRGATGIGDPDRAFGAFAEFADDAGLDEREVSWSRSHLNSPPRVPIHSSPLARSPTLTTRPPAMARA
jgi:hypothetical protein